MSSRRQIVISASRRTDIPAFYLPWFMHGIEKGHFEVINPYNRKVSIVPASPELVHTVVFWSKNFEPLIKNDIGGYLQKKRYHLFFNFTINSDSLLLEPHVPPLTERLDQLAYLCRNFGSEAINWRFDPICFYKTGDEPIRNNLGDFARIADAAARLGIGRCITSFRDDYAKIKKRIAAIPAFSFVDPPLESKLEIILEMEKTLAAGNICLFACCEKEVLAALPGDSTIAESACISNQLLVKLHGGDLFLRRDGGQRVNAGCTCQMSTDIGSYQQHPCYHNCLFCYANPASGPFPANEPLSP